MTDKLSGVLGTAYAGHRPEKEIVLLKKAAGSPAAFFKINLLLGGKQK